MGLPPAAQDGPAAALDTNKVPLLRSGRARPGCKLLPWGQALDFWWHGFSCAMACMDEVGRVRGGFFSFFPVRVWQRFLLLSGWKRPGDAVVGSRASRRVGPESGRLTRCRPAAPADADMKKPPRTGAPISFFLRGRGGRSGKKNRTAAGRRRRFRLRRF